MLLWAVVAAVLVSAGWYVQAQSAEARPDPAPLILERVHACHKEANKQRCLSSFAAELADSYPYQAIDAALRRYQTNDQTFVEDCHLLTHNLGRELYNRTRSVGEVFAVGSPVCLAGLFHGALEGYFIEKRQTAYDLSDEEMGTIIGEVCEPPDSFKTPWEHGNCYHGLGHALMFFTDSDLPRALRLCDWAVGHNLRQTCYDGAFMENDTSSQGVHPSVYSRADDPYYPCAELATAYQQECYSYSIAHRFQGDFNRSVELCRGVPATYRVDCFNRTGGHVVMNTVDPQAIADTCESIPEHELAAACVTGAGGALASRVGPASPVPAAFCTVLDPSFARNCYVAIVSVMRSLLSDPSDLNIVCNTIQDATYRKMCASKEI